MLYTSGILFFHFFANLTHCAAGPHNGRRPLQQPAAAAGGRNARSLERPTVKFSAAGASKNMANTTMGRGNSVSSMKRALNN